MLLDRPLLATITKGRAFQLTAGVGSQLLNAATNVLTAFLASYLLDPQQFGRFAIAFSAITVLLAAARGLIGGTIVAHMPSIPDEPQRSLAQGSSLKFTIVIAFGTSAILWGTSGVLGFTALFVPGVLFALIQDTFRHQLIAAKNNGSVFLLDFVWAIAQALSLSLLAGLSGRATIGWLALSWGIGALSSCIFFLLFIHSGPLLIGRARIWLRTTRDLSGWFSLTAILGQAEGYAVLLVCALLLNTQDAGGFRAIQLIAYQPAMTLLAALLVIVTPAIVTARRSVQMLQQARRRVLLFVMAVPVMSLIIWLARAPLIAHLLPQYGHYEAIVMPTAIQAALYAVAIPSLATLRGLRRGPAVFRLQALRFALLVTGALTGSVGGLAGIAWCVTASSALSTTTIVYSTRKSVSRWAFECSDSSLPVTQGSNS